MSLNVFLDDARPCPAGFTAARNFAECILLLEEFEVNVLSLDHDLGENKTGYDVAQWLVNHTRWPNEVFLHSSSLASRDKMYQLLVRHAPGHVTVHPGPMA